MRSKSADLQRLFHIVKWCRKLYLIRDEVETYENFIAVKNYRKIDLSSFYLGQIGEHARNLSNELKLETSDIPWKKINAMRNILIHNYGERDPEVIWNVITNYIPVLEARCLGLLLEYDSDIEAKINQELATETGTGEEA